MTRNCSIGFAAAFAVYVCVLVYVTTSRNDGMRAWKRTTGVKENVGEMRLVSSLSSEICFVGHWPDPDLDSVASALGGAFLYGSNCALVPGVLSGETRYVLNRFGMNGPRRLYDWENVDNYVLVDHNGEAQMSPALNKSGLLGIIDHHALARAPAPMIGPRFVDIRPWGSCSTIVGWKILHESRKKMPGSLAGVLLGGILSDTLGLRGPTTTEYDRFVSTRLANLAKVDDIEEMAFHQFQAKANETASLSSPQEILLSDFKQYSLKQNRVVLGWGTVETVEPFYSNYYSSRLSYIRDVLPSIKRAEDVDLLFMSFVDIARKRSFVIFPPNRHEAQILTRAFPGRPIKHETMDSSPMVSRKREFIPSVRRAVAE